MTSFLLLLFWLHEWMRNLILKSDEAKIFWHDLTPPRRAKMNVLNFREIYLHGFWDLRGDSPVVWPDVGIKGAPNFPKVAPKVATTVITHKVTFFKMLEISPNIWATFLIRFVAKNIKKSPNLVTLLTRCSWHSGCFHCERSCAWLQSLTFLFIF